eukprot:gnl/TRDRNA2_/TRDRNA2_195694_c0_seq1.p1 gnl/TRDRNA2_/TRDRNA2_195694_c0~~gnl/TRDRNA2_/TRDRNA2_195694_c0_seq1.p1  ORF type:complete len:296 (-),score=55.54 gnl/TRDRNA2_/TRDRNA2_195694_c0_seq1:127-1014(-)
MPEKVTQETPPLLLADVCDGTATPPPPPPGASGTGTPPLFLPDTCLGTATPPPPPRPRASGTTTPPPSCEGEASTPQLSDATKLLPRASTDGAKQSALVNDFTVRRHATEALSAGIPKSQVQKWVLECSKDFYVTDDETFARIWCEKRRHWELQRKRQLVQMRRKHADDEQGNGEKPPDASSASGKESSCRKQPRLSKQDKSEAKACVAVAKADVRAGLCASFEQALAVRLALALGTAAAAALIELMPAASGEAPPLHPLRRLALHLHPDKNSHPSAKEAFQRVAPALRDHIWRR